MSENNFCYNAVIPMRDVRRVRGAKLFKWLKINLQTVKNHLNQAQMTARRIS